MTGVQTCALPIYCDLTLNGFVPLSNFSGTFNGNGKTLTIGYRGDAQQIGLFKRLTVSVERARKIRHRHEPVQRQIAMEQHLAVAVETTAPCRIAGERFRESLEIRLAANAVVHLVSMVDLPEDVYKRQQSGSNL